MNSTHANNITQGGADNTPKGWLDLETVDFTFGLNKYAPGISNLATIRAPFEFMGGFINGTQLDKDEATHICNNLVFNTLIGDVELVINLTLSFINDVQKDPFQSIFILFDDALLVAKITGYLHPVTLNCWNGGENIYGHYRNFAVRMSQDDQYFLKDFLLNFVYNFGHIFDAARDVVLFFIEDPRGTTNLVHDMGYNVGLIQYLLITPGLA